MNWTVAELRARWRVPAVLAVTLESERLAVDYVRRENGGIRVLRSMTVAHGAGEVLDDPEGIGRKLETVLRTESIREHQCVVCVPPGWAMSAPTELPEVAADDLPSFLELRAEREFPVAVGDLLLAHSAYEVSDSGRRATLAGLPRRKVDAIRRMLGAAGCRPVSISLGLDPSWAEQSRGEHGGVNVLVNGRHVDFVVVSGGGVAALRSIPYGTPSSETGPASAPDERLGRELRITLGRLPAGVRGALSKVRFIGPPQTAAAVFEATRTVLHRLGLQGMVPASLGQGGQTVGQPLPGVGVGAAERHLQGKPMLFEFSAPELTRWQRLWRRYDTRRHRRIAAIMGAGVLLPLLVLAFRARSEARLASEWKAMQATVGELGGLQGRIRQFRPWFAAGIPSVDILHALAEAFPETGEVWAARIDVKDGVAVTCAGFARDQGAWMAFLERLGQQTGVTQLQVRSVRSENPLQVDFNFIWDPRNDP